jgi:MoaA/NifB/PqqE/SkfB family radical SAM enzyme
MLRTASLIANVHVSRLKPVSLVHFVTNRCNARCSFCFIDFDHPDTFKGELSIDEIDCISRTLGPNLQNINLTGGEPFARKDLQDIVRCYFRNTDIQSIFITSNGSLPDRMAELAKMVVSEFPSRKLIFSLSIDSFPDHHNRIRKIPNLFEHCLEAYKLLSKMGTDVFANIAITVSHENHDIVDRLYDELIDKHGVGSITATIVRDEGVYRIPADKKVKILTAYGRLTERIARDLREGRIHGYNPGTLQGRLMNKKNVLMNRIIKDTYLQPRYVSPCHAGALFGLIGANGTVRACEILDRPLGNIRNYQYDFLALWHDRPAQELKRWIRDSKCHCTYECAWSFNILGNLRYQPSLMAAAFGKDW